MKSNYVVTALVVLLVGVLVFMGVERLILRPTQIESRTVSILLDRSEAISELATLRETYSTLVSSQTEMPAGVQQIWGTDVSLFATGQVVIGVRLENLRAQDITVEEGRVRIVMPPPVYLDCYLLENATATLSRRDGWFGTTNRLIEGQARRYALQEIITVSFNEGTLATAQEQAKDVLENMVAVTALGDLTVEFVDAELPTSLDTATLPQSCQVFDN
jgi:hypothetical protein